MAEQTETTITHGFLIVKPYASLYRKYVGRYDIATDVYAIPRKDRTPEQSSIQYRGLDRDALDDFDKSDLLAEVRMAELAGEGRCEVGCQVVGSQACTGATSLMHPVTGRRKCLIRRQSDF
jgi:hypothetical protein